MADRVVIPLPGLGTLALTEEAFREALAAGGALATPTAPSVSEELLTAEQIAERLKIPQTWIEEATRQGRLPCHEFGRYKRYSLAAVIEAARLERRDGARFEH